MTRRRARLDIARGMLIRAVRGRADRGTDWGEAMLRELDEVDGRWARLRWAASSARAARRDRRGRPLLALTPPLRIAADSRADHPKGAARQRRAGGRPHARLGAVFHEDRTRPGRAKRLSQGLVRLGRLRNLKG